MHVCACAMCNADCAFEETRLYLQVHMCKCIRNSRVKVVQWEGGVWRRPRACVQCAIQIVQVKKHVHTFVFVGECASVHIRNRRVKVEWEGGACRRPGHRVEYSGPRRCILLQRTKLIAKWCKMCNVCLTQCNENPPEN